MPKPTIPLSLPHLRSLLRSLSPLPDPLRRRLSTLHPPPPSLLSPPKLFPPHPFSNSSLFRSISVRNYSSDVAGGPPPSTWDDLKTQQQSGGEEESVATLLSKELLKDPTWEPLPLPKRLDLSFSHISVSPNLILDTLNISPDAGRTSLDFFNWVKSRPDFQPSDEIYSHFVVYFGRRKDFKAAHEVLESGKGVVGVKCFEALVDRLVRAGRETQAVALFDTMEKDYGFVRNMESLKVIVSRLCEHGFASYAEKMVKGLASEFFPDEQICDALVMGWCVEDKLDEAKRLVNEMYQGGFEISTSANNSILNSVCRLCRKKDPFRLQSEAENVLTEMERNGVRRDVGTFNVLINNLCKIRKTEDAMKLYQGMGQWGCSPDATTYLVLIKSLYQAARLSEGDEMIDKMKSAGYGDALDKKAYYGFLKVLCGIERVSHALTVFGKMKRDRRKPGIKTYDLLMGKLCAHARLDKANAIYREAERRGIPVEPKSYRVDPRFVKKKPTAVKKEKKRETLPEKMARKRRTLKKIRLSFVRKPKRMRRRA